VSTTPESQSGGSAGANKLLDNPVYKWYVVGLLVLGYIFNVVDRGALGILVQPIKDELQISDTAMGLLTGFAFAFFYAFMGIPMILLQVLE
jgi:hypothetical protein